jgi:hypothetical protein
MALCISEPRHSCISFVLLLFNMHQKQNQKTVNSPSDCPGSSPGKSQDGVPDWGKDIRSRYLKRELVRSCAVSDIRCRKGEGCTKKSYDIFNPLPSPWGGLPPKSIVLLVSRSKTIRWVFHPIALGFFFSMSGPRRREIALATASLAKAQTNRKKRPFVSTRSRDFINIRVLRHDQ